MYHGPLEYKQEVIDMLKEPQEIKHSLDEYAHRIRLENESQEIKAHPYRNSQQEHNEINRQVDELLSKNLISKSISGFRAPVILVKKKMEQVGCASTIVH